MGVIYTGNEAVDKLYGIDFTGNVIPPIWYSRILTKAGKPDTVAISILAVIVYWYRPSETRDENDYSQVSLKKKFKADKLQLSYDQIKKGLGFSKDQARDALERLEKADIIRREYRTVNTKGSTLGNVMYIDLNVDKLLELTFSADDPGRKNPTRVSEKSNEVIGKKPQGIPKNPKTYTESTTKNSTKDFHTIYQSEIEAVKEQVDYDILVADHRFDKGMIDELIELIVDINRSDKDFYIVNGTSVSTEAIKEKFRKIDRYVLESALSGLKTSVGQIRNVWGYMLTTLYNAASTFETDLDMKVRHDMYVKESQAWGI